MTNHRRTISDLVAAKGWLLFLAGCFCNACPVPAQGLYNGASMYVNGASLFVDGEVGNGGALMNEGRIAFTMDWTSDGSYDGAGVLEAAGYSPQKITHYGQNVDTLQINGWGTKYVRGTLHVTGELRLMNGIIEVSPKDELSLGESAVIAGGSEQSYVDGALAAEGTGYKFFPVGKNGTYAPIQLLDIKGKSARFSVEAFENAPSVTADDAIVRNGLYWQRNDLSGVFGGSRVAVNYDPSVFNPEKIVMLSGTDWDTPFAIISNIRLDETAHTLSTQTDVTSPIVMLGEISDVWAESDFYFSTALSPNAAKAENRKVKVFGERLSGETFHLTVFNRWGAVVFETRSLDDMRDNGWDGRSTDGDALMAGAYPYKLSAVDKTGSKFEKRGVITIVY